ncbi:sodium channel protein Nach [Drosophila mojavensis]|uniref:Sodium channel protein Nach n=1 Tax=Drosophila mojavensis TaxID=7230 RepID=B4K8B7_DROMO|nr:sodium channel protein Nach [Drosophila mojavensis]EDW16499.2 uncharacterized protein Dmoj_GI22199 [Drosophila mojavensis]
MVNIESTSNAIWWIKNPNAAKAGDTAGRKVPLGSTFCQDIAELLRNISLQGYSKLLAAEFTLAERLIWLLVHTVTLVSMVAVLMLTWEHFVAQYFVINLKDPLYPVQNVPFPAVSICSNNRISLRAATAYALELQSNDPSPRELKYYLDKLTNLRQLYMLGDKETINDDYANFQAFLDIFGTWNNETFFNTRRIMHMLSPTCSEFIIKCSLNNLKIPCLSENAFQKKLTKYGPCCIFNSNNWLKKRNFTYRLADSSFGLTVVLNSSKADYLAPVLNTDGYIVIIHDADNYPAVTSSNSLEMFPGQGEESYLRIFARVIDTDNSLYSFSPYGRRCYFHTEANMPTIGSIYTFPNCITRCRIRSIIALCKCLPFQMPLELVENLDGVVYCTLAHVACLSNYQFKWNNVLTQRLRIPGLERESEEALFCPQCLPSCNDVQYSVSLNELPIDTYLASLSPDEVDTSLGTDLSVLRVFFGKPNANYYMRLLNNEWFEIFSTVGNILSIFMGFSLVAIFETLFFICKHIYLGCHRILERGRANSKEKKLDATKLKIYP